MFENVINLYTQTLVFLGILINLGVQIPKEVSDERETFEWNIYDIKGDFTAKRSYCTC